MSARNYRAQRGTSLVELMVGIAIGLILLAGMMMMLTQYIGENQRMLLDTRLQQNLRVASDIISRDLRRAGYRRDAGLAAQAMTNSSITLTTESVAISYRYTNDAAADDASGKNENAIRLRGGVLQMKDGESFWQDLTDINVVRITAFTVTPKVHEISLGHLCTPACTNASTNCPRMSVRSYDISIDAQATNDSKIVRNTRESVRVRNDDISVGACA